MTESQSPWIPALLARRRKQLQPVLHRMLDGDHSVALAAQSWGCWYLGVSFAVLQLGWLRQFCESHRSPKRGAWGPATCGFFCVLQHLQFCAVNLKLRSTVWTSKWLSELLCTSNWCHVSTRSCELCGTRWNSPVSPVAAPPLCCSWLPRQASCRRPLLQKEKSSKIKTNQWHDQQIQVQPRLNSTNILKIAVQLQWYY